MPFYFEMELCDNELCDESIEFYGVQYPTYLHDRESLERGLTFAFRKSDIVIVSFPRSGTTWLQEILLHLLYRDYEVTFEGAPWIERRNFDTYIERQALYKRRLMTTYLPAKLIYPKLKEVGCTVIYLLRNPINLLESYFYYHTTARFLRTYGNSFTFMEAYWRDELCYGNWYEHAKGWLAMDCGVITYHSLKKDFNRCLSLLDAMIGGCNSQYYQAIEARCTLTQMKINPLCNHALVPNDVLNTSAYPFLRDGRSDLSSNVTLSHTSTLVRQYIDLLKLLC